MLFNIFRVIYQKFVPSGQTFNNDYYWKILQRLRENLLTQLRRVDSSWQFTSDQCLVTAANCCLLNVWLWSFTLLTHMF